MDTIIDQHSEGSSDSAFVDCSDELQTDFSSSISNLNHHLNSDDSCASSSGLTSPKHTSTPKKVVLPRGRPRAARIPDLILEGSVSESHVKCDHCRRAFPRTKSLSAHSKTHTGDKPFACDYPGCNSAFAQSGQLSSHLRLHSGEKPFMCSMEGCKIRFAHSNRKCPSHPGKLVRVNEVEIVDENLENKTKAEQDWLENHHKIRLAKLSPKSGKRKMSTTSKVETMTQKKLCLERLDAVAGCSSDKPENNVTEVINSFEPCITADFDMQMAASVLLEFKNCARVF